MLVAYFNSLVLAEPLQFVLWQSARLTLTQLGVLRELREGPMPIGKLALALAISPASLTRVLDRLEHRKLVGRHRRSIDRRLVVVTLRAPGLRLLGEISVLEGSHVQRAVESMTVTERRQLTTLLNRLVKRSRELATGSATEPAPRALAREQRPVGLRRGTASKLRVLSESEAGHGRASKA